MCLKIYLHRIEGGGIERSTETQTICWLIEEPNAETTANA